VLICFLNFSPHPGRPIRSEWIAYFRHMGELN
jgi:hypothetical protein